MATRTKLLIAPLILCAMTVAGQEGGLSSSKPIQRPTVDNSPVTCAEAAKVIHRLQDSMETAVLAHGLGQVAIPESDKPITRVQVLDALDRLERKFEPYYALKPRTQYCNPSCLKFPALDTKKAIRLIKLGFLEPVAPMEVGPANTLTVSEFSEALGFFVARWSDCTHLPSAKWSPELQHNAPMPKPPFGSPGPTPAAASPRRASS